jgi:hypothetical protein
VIKRIFLNFNYSLIKILDGVVGVATLGCVQMTLADAFLQWSEGRFYSDDWDSYGDTFYHG